jgi:hypothetical protein
LPVRFSTAILAENEALIAEPRLEDRLARRDTLAAVGAYGATLFRFIVRLVLCGEVGEGII